MHDLDESTDLSISVILSVAQNSHSVCQSHVLSVCLSTVVIPPGIASIHQYIILGLTSHYFNAATDASLQ